MSLDNLIVWQRSVRLSAALYRNLGNLSNRGFRDQVLRAGLSIPSNIAEGWERNSMAERRMFLGYARGSSGEVRTQLMVGMEAGLIDSELGASWIQECRELSAMITALMGKTKIPSCSE